MNQQPDRTGKRGLSLVEILVAISIVTCLAWMSLVGLSRTYSSSKNVQCISNLRQIHQAMMLYCTEYQSYPYPDKDHTLKGMLRPWLGAASEIFHCPEDHTTAIDSYSYYYAPRSFMDDPDNYMLGCPRHQQFTRGVVLYTGANTLTPPVGSIIHDTVLVAPGEEFDGGTFQYTDGSTAFITMGLGNGGPPPGGGQPPPGSPGNDDRPILSTLMSIQRNDGTWYTVVKMKPGKHGKASFSVVPGNRFDVITETAVIAVRGTVFSVETLHAGGKPATQVDVTSGTVEVESAVTGRPLKLDVTPGKNRAIVIAGEPPTYN